MKYQCLIVDDDRLIAESTAEYFNMFDVVTGYVLDFDSAVSFLDENEVSLVLLDINLDNRSGFELCKLIRKKYNMPILFISARTSDDDVLTALNIGGDDYIKKPYTLNILLAKVKAILKRYEAQMVSSDYASRENEGTDSDKICIRNSLYLDTKTYRLLDGSQSVMLKSMEYKLLLYLLQNRNRVVTKDELFTNVWDDNFVGEGTLAVHIRHLREKIEIDVTNPEVIKTIWGVGYIIEEFADEKI